jgi:hypothetical protein
VAKFLALDHKTLHTAARDAILWPILQEIWEMPWAKENSGTRPDPSLPSLSQTFTNVLCAPARQKTAAVLHSQKDFW